MPEKPEPKTYPLADAVHVARELLDYFGPYCHRIMVVGSIRRRKPFVKDVELLMVGRVAALTDINDLFENKVPTLLTLRATQELLDGGYITKRPNSEGHFTWGPENKLAIHRKSGMPLDLFFTDERRWWNALVVRTGPAKSNKAIAAAALAKGWKWHAYGDGFTRGEGKASIDKFVVKQERDAFDFVGIPYLQPEKR